MKKLYIYPIVLSALLLSGCSGSSTNSSSTSGTSTSGDTSSGDNVPGTGTSVTSVSVSDSSFDQEETTAEFTITTSVSNGYSLSGSVYTITLPGEYTLAGKLIGQIVISATDSDEVDLNLNGVSITCSTNSPILAWTADSVKIKSIDGTYNKITDSRTLKTADDTTQGNGAIYAKCDLSLTGTGTLDVAAAYDNGVHSTKDLKIKNVTLKSVAPNNAFKGNDSFTMESGTVYAISTGGDGIKTEDSDISDKGNQRGTVDIQGGNLEIYAACDGIDASYNVNIADGVSLKIYTDKYSDYSSDLVSSSSSTIYLRMSSNYTSSYRFALYCYNSDTDYVWKDASYYTSISSGGGHGSSTNYYYYKVDKPSNYTSFKVAMFSSSVTTDSLSGAKVVSSGSTFSSAYDTMTLSVSTSSISVSGWTTYTTSSSQGGPGGQSQGNTNKTDYSCKGIKSQNDIVISGGTIIIYSTDDCLHSNYGETLGNTLTSTGNLTISAGSLTLASGDDALHSDNYLYISGGSINILTAYEAIEGTHIEISGGSTALYATDDGVNAAAKSDSNPSIVVSGGRVDIVIATGDVDGIDSNGSFSQTGGVIVTRGAQGGSSNMATGLDVDGSCTMSGGTFIQLGATESTPTLSSGVLKATGTSLSFSGSSSSPTTYTISTLNISFSTVASYTGFRIFSSLLSSGTSYTLSGGSLSKTWTQSSSGSTIS